MKLGFHKGTGTSWEEGRNPRGGDGSEGHGTSERRRGIGGGGVQRVTGHTLGGGEE